MSFRISSPFQYIFFPELLRPLLRTYRKLLLYINSIGHHRGLSSSSCLLRVVRTVDAKRLRAPHNYTKGAVIVLHQSVEESYITTTTANYCSIGWATK